MLINVLGVLVKETKYSISILEYNDIFNANISFFVSLTSALEALVNKTLYLLIHSQTESSIISVFYGCHN